MQNKLKVASFFCGCGGSDLGILGGFEYLGKRYNLLPFEIVYAIDIDDKAVETYNMNFRHKAICGDVCKVDFTSIPDSDVLIGGFPCQSFSTVNPTKDTNDDRANLYKQIVKYLRLKKPKFFICENVKGLMTLKNGSIIDKIIGEFSDCGYNVKYKLMKAVEFGIPQRRERIFIVGVRNDLLFNYHFPDPLYMEENAVPLSSVIEEVAIKEKRYYFSTKAVEGVKNAKPNMKRALWQNLSAPCLTITSHLAKVSMNSRDPILLVDEEKELYRRFTPREAARIQSFPDSFQINFSESKAYQQIGNAVPPVLMWYIAKQLQKALKCTGNVLIGLVKGKQTYLSKFDYQEQDKNPVANLYYSGQRFPSTYKLKKLDYFVPCVEGKTRDGHVGIRDLYLIKEIFTMSREDISKIIGDESKDKSLRIGFEIEFIKSLAEEYIPFDPFKMGLYKKSLGKATLVRKEDGNIGVEYKGEVII